MPKSKPRFELIKRILVPTDGSKEALEAAAYAGELARLCGAEIGLLHVVEPISQRVLFMTSAGLDAIQPVLHEAGRTVLDLTRKTVLLAGVQPSIELREGRAGDEIVELAKEGKYDLIVMGNRGVGMAESLILGSVSAHVTRHAPCPVLIVRGDWPGRSVAGQEEQRE